MQIFVKTVSGRTLSLDVASNDAEVVKAAVAASEGVPTTLQRLVAGGCAVTEVAEGCTYEVHLDVLGGGKKHKKKNYTTPKKIKHKHKTVKLAVLRYYQVDETGKVTKLRKECSHQDCGPGVFMANHFNRYYCGKCHLTYHVENTTEA